MRPISAPSQLLLRHAEAFGDRPLWLINPSDASCLSALQAVSVWHLHAGIADTWPQTPGAHSHFGASPLPPPATVADALLWLPKEKLLAQYLCHAIASLLPVGARLWLLGDNRGGIKSFGKALPDYWSAPQKMALGNHSLMLQSTLLAAPPPFSVEQYLVHSDIDQPGQAQPLRLASLPGVFAYPNIDLGSHMLLQHLPAWQHGSVLDFACGHGILGAWLQRQAPALEVSYLDVSAMALAAAAATLQANHLKGQLLAHEGLPSSLPRYHYVVSHPPFHTGLAIDYQIGQQFLQQVRQHLQRHGELWLVANRFLPWPELLTAHFGRFERIAQDNKFAVYRAVAGGAH